MSEPLTQEHLQYLYCAVCLECQDVLPAGQTPQMAITIINGTAACEEHRRRCRFDIGQVIANARKFYQEGPRSLRNGRSQSPYGGRP